MISDKITVIIPTLNEAQGIGPTIQDVIEKIGEPQVLVIDANSVDGTPQIAASLGAKVIRQLGRGKGRAVSQVLQHIAEDTKWVVMIDGDYGYPATYIPNMIKTLDENEDVGMVTGRRASAFQYKTLLDVIGGRRRLHYLRHYFQHHALFLLHHIMNRINLEDPLSGLRVFRYNCIKDFRPKAKGFDIEVELNCYIRREGYRTLEVPIKMRPRLGAAKFDYSKHGPLLVMRMMIMACEDGVSRLKALFRQVRNMSKNKS